MYIVVLMSWGNLIKIGQLGVYVFTGSRSLSSYMLEEVYTLVLCKCNYLRIV